MLKRVFIVILLFLIAGAGISAWVISSPKATARVLKFMLQKNLRSAVVDELTIGAQKLSSLELLSFFDVQVMITASGQQYRIHAPELQVENVGEVLLKPGELRIHGKNVSLDNAGIHIPSAEIKAKVLVRSKQKNIFQGSFAIPMMEAYKYKAQDVSANFTGGTYGLSLKNFQAGFYNGKVLGKIDVNWAQGVHYRTSLQFEGVDISALKDVDASVYGQVDGVIQGTVVIGGSAHTFDTLRLKMQVTRDGRINASLLKFVLPYIPQTEGSAKLTDMMSKGLKVPVEVAHVELRSMDEHKLSGNVKLGVGQLNLDLNLPVDILYDGNLFSLIEWYRKLGK